MSWNRLDEKAETEYSLQDAMHVATGMLGWLVPDTDAVVKATSMEDGQITSEIPDELRDPFAALDRNRDDEGDRVVDPAA